MNTVVHTKEWQETNLKRRIVLDIETIPNPEMIKHLPEAKIDSRLKDPIKVAEAKSEAKQNQLEKMALSPLTGRVACVGWYDGETDIASVIDLGQPTSEKDLLDATFAMMQNYEVITYNGKSFDIPFIFKRGLMLGCEWATIPKMKEYTDRYKAINHIDLMAEFCNYGEYEKLDSLARYILGYGKDEFDVTKIGTLIQTEEGKKQVSDYCRKDCKITWELAKRMGF